MCFKKVNYLPNISINTWLQTKYSFLRALSSMTIYLIHIKLQLLLLEGLEYFPPFFFSSFQTKLQSQRKYEQARGYFFCDVDILHSAALGGVDQKTPSLWKTSSQSPSCSLGSTSGAVILLSVNVGMTRRHSIRSHWKHMAASHLSISFWCLSQTHPRSRAVHVWMLNWRKLSFSYF